MKHLEVHDIHSLRFENMSFSYENHREVFHTVDFEFPMNNLTWIKGASGVGRSTMMQLLAGLIFPTEGKYLINDQNVTDLSFEEFLPYRLRIGYGFDMGGLLHNRTLLENLMLPLLYHRVLNFKNAEKRVLEYLTLFGVEKYKDRRPNSVSGGTRKMICLIRALVMHPQVLLLDEPTVGLNQETALKYFDLLQRLRSEGHLRSIFVSTFDDKVMSIVPHQCIYIHDHKLFHENIESARGVAV